MRDFGHRWHVFAPEQTRQRAISADLGMVYAPDEVPRSLAGRGARRGRANVRRQGASESRRELGGRHLSLPGRDAGGPPTE